MAESDIERAYRLARHLPGVETSTWYGTPALKVRRTPANIVGFARVKEAGVLVVLCPLDLKEALMEAEPSAYFETDHYRGWAAMLVRMDAADDEALAARLECAWREKASAKMVTAWDEGQR